MLNSGKNMDKDFVKEKSCGDDDLIWKECSKKEILSIPVFSVMETTSISPEGETGNYYVMDANDWVITIPVMGKDFLMVKQWRHGEKQISIEFPGGVLEKGEDAEDGAKRELREETGFEAKKMVHYGRMSEISPITREYRYMTPDDCEKFHKESKKYIEFAYNKIVEKNPNATIILMTHHPFTKKCESAKYRGEPLNAAFISDEDKWLKKFPNIKYLIAGMFILDALIKPVTNK